MLRTFLAVGLATGLAVSLPACDKSQKTSIERTNEGVKAIDKKQWDVAVAKLEEATAAYKDNHSAHYNLGIAYHQQGKHLEASRAFEAAVKLSPKDPMYHMRHGISLYNAAIAEAQNRQAQAEGKKADEIDINNLDLKGSNFDPALAALNQAVSINEQLFRAHYYVGRIHRHLGNAKEAADAFSKAIETGPRFPDPYIALGELYRRWDYTDEAIKVLSNGKQYVPGDKERAELLFALGMAYDDKKDYAKAVEEFTASLEADKNNQRARFQRGMAFFKLQKFDDAKADLEAYSKSGKDEYMKGVASRRLQDIMFRQN